MKLKFNGFLALLVVLITQITFAQDIAVTGVVQDQTGLPVPGVNVLIKGTTTGTQTDFDGKFKISAARGQVLVFSFLGLKSVEMAASTNMTVKMADDAVQLEGVVITALGIRKNKDQLTSAQQVVNNRELTQAANPNVIQSLTGKISGLQINNSTGGVNGTQRIQFRGSRSITGSNEALIVIDNAISTAAVLQQLPPETIESVNAVKGPQGAALYGEQGANGVLIVTTKKGTKSEKLSVSVNSTVDFETISFVPERQTKYGQGWNGAVDRYENGGWGAPFDGSMQEVGLTQADGSTIMSPYSAIKDNWKQFYKTGVTTQNSVTLNAGGEDAYALLTASNVNTEFIVKGDELNRNSFLFKAGKKIGKLRIEGNVNYAAQKTQQANAEDNRNGILHTLYMSASNIPISRFENSGTQGWTAYYKNPYWVRDNNRLERNQTTLNAIASLSYEINKNISLQYTGNLRLNSNHGMSYINGYDDLVEEGGASVSQTSEYYSNQASTRNYYGDLLLNLNYMLTDKISLKANIGNNVQDATFRITSQGGTNLDIPGWYHINNILSPAKASQLDNRYVRSRKVAYFGNLDLAYDDYLFLNGTARVESSSTIRKEDRTIFYPSVGLSFIPTKAFDNIKGDVLNYMKLSASVVQIGSSGAVNPYAINNTAGIPVGFPYGDNSSYLVNTAQTAADIKPETVVTKEVGVSLGFFNDRITIDAAAYTADTDDLITRANTSSASGIRSLLSNVGKLKTDGFEIDLGITPIRTENFKWDLRGSFTTYKTVVKELANGVDEIALFTSNSTRNADGFAVSNIASGIYAVVGEEFPMIKGTTYLRDDAGNVIIGANGMPQISSTFNNLGKVTPDYILGLSTSVEYKGFRLSAVMDYRTGNKVISESKYDLTWTGHLEESADFDRDLGFIYPGSVIADPANPGSYIDNATAATPIVSAAGYGPNGIINYYDRLSKAGEHNVIDASAFRVRELALSYDVPARFLEKTGLTGVKFGVNARNPFIVLAKSNKGYGDPESDNILRSASSNTALRASGNTSANGVGYMGVGNYPSTRTFGASVNLTF